MTNAYQEPPGAPGPVGELMDSVIWPEIVNMLVRMRDEYGLSAEQQALDAALGEFYCVRCHHRHFDWSMIGRRHSGAQPLTLPSGQ